MVKSSGATTLPACAQMITVKEVQYGDGYEQMSEGPGVEQDLLLHLTEQVNHHHPSLSVGVPNSNSATGTRHHQLVSHVAV